MNDLRDESQVSNKVGEFLGLMKKKDEDCPEDDDCGNVLSSCCSVLVLTVFGSHPLKIRCSNCDKEYLLKEIVGTL